MSFSVIIPTMFMAPEELVFMLAKYNDSSLVDEILVIKNSPVAHPSGYRKVRVLNDGKNLFVNPSWNIGVANAKAEKVLIANDDIMIDNLDEVLQHLHDNVCEGMIVGPSPNCFMQKRREPLGPMIIYPAVGERKYGFGVFMCVFRESYIQIPYELKVWYGDTFLYRKLEPHLLHGVDIKTQMRMTSKNMDLRKQHAYETKYFSSLWEMQLK